jgi:glucose-1-phosphate thymidylyltransferase
MNIIIPMAGMGKRMRPHTLTVPKPLIPVAGKPIVERLVEDIAGVCSEKVDHIGFVIGRFGVETELHLLEMASRVGAKGHIFYQDEALGTAHAVHCASELLEGPVVIAFADTLFSANFKIDTQVEGMIWVQKVVDPSAFGVVLVNESNEITGMVEKPESFVSDLAIIGIYYMKEGGLIRDEIAYLLDNDIKEKGEFQLTNALERLREKGFTFVAGAVDEWLDCGNKEATLNTNARMLSLKAGSESMVSDSLVSRNSLVIEPCFLGKNVVISNSIVGPFVSLGEGTIVENSHVSNSIVQKHAHISHSVVANSMLGNHTKLKGRPCDVSMGDYSVLE